MNSFRHISVGDKTSSIGEKAGPFTFGKLEDLFVIFSIIALTSAFLRFFAGEEVYRAQEGGKFQQILYSMIFMSGLVLAISTGDRRKRFADALTSRSFIWILNVWVFFSIIWAVDPMVSLRRVSALLLLTGYCAYIASRYSLREFLELFVIALSICILSSFIITIFSPEMGLNQTEAKVYETAWRGVFYHKNRLGNLALLNILSLMALMQVSQKNRFAKVLLIMISFFVLLKSNSVTPLLLIFPIMCFMYFAKGIRLDLGLLIPIIQLILLVISITFLWLFSNSGQSFLSDAFASFGRDTTLTGRVDVWEKLIVAIGKHPLVGYGLGGYFLGDTGPSAELARDGGWLAPSAHNAYLDIWINIGAIGLVLFTLTFFFALSRLVKQIRQKGSGVDIWALVCLVEMAVYGISGNPFLQTNDPFWFLYMFLVISVATHYTPKRASRYLRTVSVPKKHNADMVGFYPKFGESVQIKTQRDKSGDQPMHSELGFHGLSFPRGPVLPVSLGLMLDPSSQDPILAPAKTTTHGAQKRTAKSLPKSGLFAAISTLGNYGVKIFAYSIYARLFGASSDMDIYLLIFGVALWLNSILGLSIAKVIIPTVVGIRENEGETSSNQLTNSIVVFLLFSVFVFSLFFFFASPILASGLVNNLYDTSKSTLILQIIRLSIIYVFLSFSQAIFEAILSSFEDFIFTKTIIFLSNLLLISVIILFAKDLGVVSIALGEILSAALVSVLFLIRLYHKGFSLLPFNLNFRHHALSSLFTMMLPLMTYEILFKSTPVIDRLFAARLEPGDISVLNFAFNVSNPFFMIISSAVWIYLPRLSVWVAQQERTRLNVTLHQLLHFCVYAVVPATCLTITMGANIVAILYQSGEFEASDTARTASVVVLYSGYLVAQTLSMSFVQVIYAFKNTTMTMKRGVIYFVCNILTDALFIRIWGYKGIALSTSITSIIHLGVAFYFAKTLLPDFKVDYRIALRPMIGGGFMSLSIFLLSKITAVDAFHGLTVSNLAVLSLISFGGIFIYIISTFLMSDELIVSFFNEMKQKLRVFRFRNDYA